MFSLVNGNVGDVCMLVAECLTTSLELIATHVMLAVTQMISPSVASWVLTFETVVHGMPYVAEWS